jgi:hypothetical protein
MPADGGNAEHILCQFAESGVDVAEVATRLQREGA